MSAADRLAVLRAAVRDYQGEWTTRTVLNLYRAKGHNVPQRKTARDDLALLARQGLLVLDDTNPGRRVFRLNAQRGAQ